MGQVRECHIKNSHIRTIFYNIPCIRNQLAFRQLTYAGKILCHEKSHVPTRFLTAWCNNPRKRGGQLLTNKYSLVWNLQLITPGIDDAGLVSTWGFHALDTTHWFLLLAMIKHPANTTPDQPTNEQEADRDATQPNPPPPLPPPLEEVAGSQADRKGLTGRGPLTIFLLHRLP